jgi:hypothetical protein
MIRGATLLWILVAISTGVGMFMLKYQVQAMESKLIIAQRQIRIEQESIHAAKADWSYLNDPIRLRDLGERYVEMRPIRAKQMIAIEALPAPVSAKPEPQAQPMSAPPPPASKTPPASQPSVQTPLFGAELASVRRTP